MPLSVKTQVLHHSRQFQYTPFLSIYLSITPQKQLITSDLRSQKINLTNRYYFTSYKWNHVAFLYYFEAYPFLLCVVPSLLSIILLFSNIYFPLYEHLDYFQCWSFLSKTHSEQSYRIFFGEPFL